jgi:hypothetical protein
VVFCGGGGLLLLMQPDSIPIIPSETNIAFILVPSWVTMTVSVVFRTPLASTVIQTLDCA